MFFDLRKFVLEILVLLYIRLFSLFQEKLLDDKPVEKRLFPAFGGNHHLHVHRDLVELLVELGHCDLIVIDGDEYFAVILLFAGKQTGDQYQADRADQSIFHSTPLKQSGFYIHLS